MENFKIQINQAKLKSSTIYAIFMFLMCLYISYLTFGEFQKDVEEFDWSTVMQFFVWIPLFSTLSFRYVISAWNLKRKYGMSDDGWIEMPGAEVTGIQNNSGFLILQTIGGVFYLSASHLDGIKQGSLRLPFNSRQPKLLFLRRLWGFMMALALISIFSQVISVFQTVSKYDIKYLLPLKQIEVVEVEGILNRPLSIKIPSLLSFENHQLNFEYLSSCKLADAFVKDTTNFRMPKGTAVKIKIRKEDLERFEASKNQKNGYKKIRFYELKMGEELLLQKMGLIE